MGTLSYCYLAVKTRYITAVRVSLTYFASTVVPRTWGGPRKIMVLVLFVFTATSTFMRSQRFLGADENHADDSARMKTRRTVVVVRTSLCDRQRHHHLLYASYESAQDAPKNQPVIWRGFYGLTRRDGIRGLELRRDGQVKFKFERDGSFHTVDFRATRRIIICPVHATHERSLRQDQATMGTRVAFQESFHCHPDAAQGKEIHRNHSLISSTQEVLWVSLQASKMRSS